MHSPSDSVGKGVMFMGCPSVLSFVRLSRQILLPLYLMNGLSNPDGTHREYSLTSTDDVGRFWRSKVKVTESRRDGEGIHVHTGASKSIFYR